MLLRTRDIVAVLFAVILSHQAWNRQESLSATVHLAFYMPRHQRQFMDTLMPVILDVDGDGTPEALVDYYTTDSSASWKLQVLDIAALQQQRRGLGVPFEPRTVLESEPILAREIEQTTKHHPDGLPIQPLRMVVGHVMMGRDPHETKTQAAKTTTDSSGTQIDERTRRWFCGTDWHDAASKCTTPCPNGMSSSCPTGERCFADTPCDYHDVKTESTSQHTTTTSRLENAQNVSQTFHLTPQGGLPSVTTLWSNGVVTLHSIAATKSSGKAKLSVQLMWQTSLLKQPALDWSEHTMTFVDAIDADNGSGMILISGTLDVEKEAERNEDKTVIQEQNMESTVVVVAIHARTGKVMWRSTLQDDDNDDDTPILPLAQRASTSMARRRSLIPNIQQQDNRRDSTTQQHCLKSSFRRTLLTSTSSSSTGALPFAYWTEEDASIRTIHFDLQQPKSSSLLHPQKQAPVVKSPHKHTKAKKKRRPHQKAKYGKPNVVVTHDQTGLQVRSLRNGRSLCHLGLAEERLYADLNHDGTLDSVHIATGSLVLSEEDLKREQAQGEQQDDADDDFRFITGLAKRMALPTTDTKKQQQQQVSGPAQANLCHLVALSGFPSKEELFSIDLCGGARRQQHHHQQVEGAPPLIVEPLYGKGWDIIAAVNTGWVHRIRGSNGRRQWKFDGSQHADFATWSDRELVLLRRVESYNVIPATRPIVLVGQNALAILSADKGTLLASASFPQRSLGRAVMVDFNGDGTSDILVQTTDALWGFQIVVSTGSTIGLRIMVGLLFMALLLALLRNRFGPHPGKRSTDL